jgi:nicotinate-nucleotide--dimethylbenzimidazole phosphoribosyltransferase
VRPLEDTLARIEGPDAETAAAARKAIDEKTKPRGSLGGLEDMAVRIASTRRTLDLQPLRTAVVVAAADHGVASEGVSAYPQEVTREMLANFETGGAAVCVLARRAGASLHIVDVGVGEGTSNIAVGPAMSRRDAVDRIERGIAFSRELSDEGIDVVALGEMGIGNTTAAAALCAALLRVGVSTVCGAGTGLDADGIAHKVAVVERALAVNAPDPEDPVGVLAAVGGFELAFLCGVALEAAAARLVVVLDGFIVGAAALVAARLSPAVTGSMIAAHVSTEPGHRRVLQALGLEPLLDLGLRLGEGSGATLALPLLSASVAILEEMATFESAGVTDAGR